MDHQRVMTMTEEYKVPDRLVVFITGKNGEQIKRIQLESGCNILFAEYRYNLMERPCSLTGTREQIEQAKRMLAQIVARCLNGPGYHDVDGASVQEMLIPASKVGLLIGKGTWLQATAGVNMQMIGEATVTAGVNMQMIGLKKTGADIRLCIVLRCISGDPDEVQAARELVLEVIGEKDQGDFRTRLHCHDFTAMLGGSTLNVAVPRFAVGIVIGWNEDIQDVTGVRIQFKPDDGISPARVAMVMGQPDRCQHAAHLINNLIQTAQERAGLGSAVRGGGRVRSCSDGTLQEVSYTIPADKCGPVSKKDVPVTAPKRKNVSNVETYPVKKAKAEGKTVMSKKSSKKPQKKLPVCQVCHVSLTSGKKNEDQHNRGKKHQKKLKNAA